MLTFVMAGGWSSLWLLAIGVPLLLLAGVFMFRGNHRHLAILRALSLAVAFASISGVAHDLIAVAWKGVPARRNDPEFMYLVIQGLGEAITPAALGFTLLSLAWLFIAVGMRRPDLASE